MSICGDQKLNEHNNNDLLLSLRSAAERDSLARGEQMRARVPNRLNFKRFISFSADSHRRFANEERFLSIFRFPLKTNKQEMFRSH